MSNECRRSGPAAINYFTPGIEGRKKKLAYIQGHIPRFAIDSFRTAWEMGYRAALDDAKKGLKP